MSCHHVREVCEKCGTVLLQCRCMEQKVDTPNGLCKACMLNEKEPPTYTDLQNLCEEQKQLIASGPTVNDDLRCENENLKAQLSEQKGEIERLKKSILDYELDLRIESALKQVRDAAKKEEREACIKSCEAVVAQAKKDDKQYGHENDATYYGMMRGAEDCITAIRQME